MKVCLIGVVIVARSSESNSRRTSWQRMTLTRKYMPQAITPYGFVESMPVPVLGLMAFIETERMMYA